MINMMRAVKKNKKSFFLNPYSDFFIKSILICSALIVDINKVFMNNLLNF